MKLARKPRSQATYSHLHSGTLQSDTVPAVSYNKQEKSTWRRVHTVGKVSTPYKARLESPGTQQWYKWPGSRVTSNVCTHTQCRMQKSKEALHLRIRDIESCYVQACTGWHWRCSLGGSIHWSRVTQPLSPKAPESEGEKTAAGRPRSWLPWLPRALSERRWRVKQWFWGGQWEADSCNPMVFLFLPPPPPWYPV